MLPKAAIMQMMTTGPGSDGKPGKPWKSRHAAAPTAAPITIPGPKMPPTRRTRC